MKKLIFILFMVITISSFGQYSDDYINKKQSKNTIVLSSIFPVKDSMIFYSGVVVMNDSISKDALFKKAKSAVTSVLKSDKDIIQSQDLDIGLIVSKGFIVKGHNMYIKNPQMWFTFRIEVKDGKYKYSLTDVTYKFDVSVSTGVDYISSINNSYDLSFEKWISPNTKRGKMNKRATEDFLRQIDSELKAVIASFKTKMQQKEESW